MFTKINLELLLQHTKDAALKRRARWLIAQLNPKNGENILDVGCGDGYYLYILSHLNSTLKLTGVDFDPKALRSARKNVGGNIKLIRADLMDTLPFRTGSFDKIVMSEVLEHLPDDIKGAKEVYRILKPKGIIVVSVPYKNYPFFWDPINWILEHLFKTHIKSGFWSGIWNQHLRLYSDNKLRTLLEVVGFKNIAIAKLTHYSLPFNHYLINIFARILTSKKIPKDMHDSLNKFKASQKSKEEFGIFKFIFLLDRLNDSWSGRGAAVSLVAKGIK